MGEICPFRKQVDIYYNSSIIVYKDAGTRHVTKRNTPVT